MKILPEGPDKTPTHLYNPDSRDFIFVQADDENLKHTYILKAQDITTLPKYTADKGARELADMLVWKRGIKTNYEDELAQVLKTIYIK